MANVRKHSYNYISYEKGELFVNCKFVSESVTPACLKKQDARYAVFECKCGNTFTAQLDSVKKRGGRCKDCRTLVNKKKKAKIYFEGQKIGSCFFVKEVPNCNGVVRRAIFKCECGNHFENTIKTVQKGKKICRICTLKRLERTGIKSSGDYQSKEYKAWNNSKNRCYNKKCSKYEYYGGRGIKVCERWRASYYNFLEDMGRAPSKLHSLDRIDVNGDYSKENCRWATRKEQARNKRNNIFIEYNGENKSIPDWAEIYGMSSTNLTERIFERGMTLEEAFNTPLRIKRKYKP